MDFRLPTLAYSLLVIGLFLAYGVIVRRGKLQGPAILFAGALVGFVAVVAAFFNLPPPIRAAATPLRFLGPGMMGLCAVFCVALAYRAQQVIEMLRRAVGDTIVTLEYRPAAKITADALLLPTDNALRLRSSAASAIVSVGGAELSRDATRQAPVGAGKVVAITPGRLNVEKVILAAVHDPGRPADLRSLKRGIENAAVRARQAGAQHIAVVLTALPGLAVNDSITAIVEGALKQQRAFAEISFTALDMRTGAAAKPILQEILGEEPASDTNA